MRVLTQMPEQRRKMLLAVLTIVCMLGFVIVPTFLQSQQGRQRQPGVLATTKFGAITEQEVARLRMDRTIVNEFCRTLAMGAMRAGHFNFQQNLFPMSGTDDQSIIDGLLIAEQASSMGMTVNNDSVNQYIRELTGEKLSNEGIRQAIDSVTHKNFTTQQLYDALAREIQIIRFNQMFIGGLGQVPPAQRWEYYLRTKRRAKCEVAAVPVADFVSSVADPSAAELRAYFDKHKDRLPNPNSAEAGFKEPRRIAVQYLIADLDDFKKRVADEVTDEDVAAYYDKNKEAYRKTELDLEIEKQEQKKREKEAAEEGEKQPESDPATPAADDKPDGDAAARATEKSENPAPTNEPKGKQPEAQPEGKASDSPQTSFRGASSAFRLTAFQEPAAADKTKAAEEAKPGEEAKPAAEADPAPAGDQPNDNAEGVPETPQTETGEADAPETTEGKAKPAPVYKSLDEVKEKIRDQLVESKAIAAMEAALQQMARRLDRYYQDLLAVKGSKLAPPKQPDIKAFATEKGLALNAVPLMSFEEFEANEALGGSFSMNGQNPRRELFQDDVLYRPVMLKDVSANRLLIWKTEDKPEVVPDLDDAAVRERVILRWKLEQAREAATKRAEELVALAQGKEAPLSEVLKDQELNVVETQEFPWLLRAPQQEMGQAPYRISPIVGVEKPGDELMKKVFALQPGELGQAFNEPQTIVYVIRLIDYEKPLANLRAEFMADSFDTYQRVAFADQMAVMQQFRKRLHEQAGLTTVKSVEGEEGP